MKATGKHLSSSFIVNQIMQLKSTVNWAAEVKVHVTCNDTQATLPTWRSQEEIFDRDKVWVVLDRDREFNVRLSQQPQKHGSMRERGGGKGEKTRDLLINAWSFAYAIFEEKKVETNKENVFRLITIVELLFWSKNCRTKLLFLYN